MVRTFASFAWNIPIPDDDKPPFAQPEIERFVAALRAAGLNVSPPEAQQYAWGFDCRLPYLRMECRLGLVGGEPERWLLACYPRRGWADWWRGQWREGEQERFVSLADAVLRADDKVSELRWYAQEEWNRAGF